MGVGVLLCTVPKGTAVEKNGEKGFCISEGEEDAGCCVSGPAEVNDFLLRFRGDRPVVRAPAYPEDLLVPEMDGRGSGRVSVGAVMRLVVAEDEGALARFALCWGTRGGTVGPPVEGVAAAAAAATEVPAAPSLRFVASSRGGGTLVDDERVFPATWVGGGVSADFVWPFADLPAKKGNVVMSSRDLNMLFSPMGEAPIALSFLRRMAVVASSKHQSTNCLYFLANIGRSVLLFGSPSDLREVNSAAGSHCFNCFNKASHVMLFNRS